MMNVQDFIDGLNALGFKQGYAVGGDPVEIILWENEAKQPSNSAINKAITQGRYQRDYAEVEELRRQAYNRESDPLFFGFQRGDNTEQEWLDAVAKVKLDNPYPEQPTTK